MKAMTLFTAFPLLTMLHATAAETKPHSERFDLSHWKLTLPVGTTGRTEGHPMEVSATRLSTGYTHAE